METPLPYYFDLLRKCILAKAGIATISPGDCKRIAFDIATALEKRVSETTLKRFFGFADRKYSFSRYTVNTLCEYLGYGGWQAFRKDAAVKDAAQLVAGSSYWQALRRAAAVISDITLEAIRRRCGIPFGLTVPASSPEAEFGYFIESPFKLATLTAPPGAGKSVLLARLVQKFFRNPASRYHNDVVWFVSAAVLPDLAAAGFRPDGWFGGHAGTGGHMDFRDYFKRCPAAVNGRIFLVLDGFDAGRLNDVQLDKLFENIAGQLCDHEETPWLKIVAALRPPARMRLEEKLNNAGHLRDYWYPGRFFGEEGTSGTPMLGREEATAFLAAVENRPAGSRRSDPRLLAQLRHPFYLQLYYELKGKDAAFDCERQDAYFSLVAEFVLKKIYRTKRSTEKVALIHRFITLADSGLNAAAVEKKQLLSFISRFPLAYEELVSHGVWMEENRSDSLGHRETVRFTHPGIFEYFVAQALIEEHEKALPALFGEITRRFKSEQRKTVLQWVIRSTVKAEGLKVVKTLLERHLSSAEKETLAPFMKELSRQYRRQVPETACCTALH